MPDKGPRATKRRADMACQVCRQRKLRCTNKNSEPPCERCRNDPSKCVFVPVSEDTLRRSSTPTGEEYNGGGAPPFSGSPMLSTQRQEPFYNEPPTLPQARDNGYVHPPSPRDMPRSAHVMAKDHFQPHNTYMLPTMGCPQPEEPPRMWSTERFIDHNVQNYAMAVEPSITSQNQFSYSPVPCLPFNNAPTNVPRSQPATHLSPYPASPYVNVPPHEGFQQTNQHSNNYPSTSSGFQQSYSPYNNQQQSYHQWSR